MRIPNLVTGVTARLPGDWKHLSLFSGSGMSSLPSRIRLARRRGLQVSDDGFVATPDGPRHIDDFPRKKEERNFVEITQETEAHRSHRQAPVVEIAAC